MQAHEGQLSPPEGAQIIGPALDIVGYIQDLAVASIIFSQPVKLTMAYDPGLLSSNVSRVYLASYHVAQGWHELQTTAGIQVGQGRLSALISQASTCAILEELKSPVMVPTSPEPVVPVTVILAPLPPAPAEPGINSTVLPPPPGENTDGLNQSVPKTQPDVTKALRLLSLSIIITGSIVMVILIVIQWRRRAYQKEETA